MQITMPVGPFTCTNWLLSPPPAEQEPCVENTGAMDSGLPALARHGQNERVMALGRKNFLFAGSDTGGDRAASRYTIVQTAKLNGVNPEAYLKDTLAKIAEGHPINKLDQLMPWQMSPPAADQPP
jgi:hypothetical protein